MIEMRILCKILPKTFDDLENFIDSINYLPLNNNNDNNQNSIQIKNKRYKFIQETKRTLLNNSFNVYENKILKYDQQYENEFKQLETQLLNSITINGSSVFNTIKEYITYFTNRLQQEISDQVSSSRGILLQNRQRSSTAKHMIGVSPESYLDLIDNPFNTLEWNQLSLGTTIFFSKETFNIIVFCFA